MILAGCNSFVTPTPGPSLTGAMDFTFEVSDDQVQPGQLIEFRVELVNNTNRTVSFYYMLLVNGRLVRERGPYFAQPGKKALSLYFTGLAPEDAVGEVTFTFRIDSNFPVEPSKQKTIKVKVVRKMQDGA
jgi:hypothetical protein